MKKDKKNIKLISYKYRLQYLHKGQMKRIDRDLELCRQIYNWALGKSIEEYEKTKKSASVFTRQKELTKLKKVEKKYNLVYSGCLTNVIDRLGKAYQNFFRRVKAGENPGFPNFKKYGYYNSMTRQYQLSKPAMIDNSFEFSKNIGILKTSKHERPLPIGKVKTITLSRDGHKYFVSFSIEVNDKFFIKKIEEVKRPKILTLGGDYLSVSDKNYITPQPHIYVRYEKDLARVNRRMDRVKYLKPDDPAKMKVRRALHKIYTKIRNLRNEFLQKKALELVKNFDKIEVNDLGLKAKLERNPDTEYNKTTLDTSYYNFSEKLKWQCEKRGLIFVKNKT